MELLKRVLNCVVACGKLPNNPVANARLLRKPNVRRVVPDEAAFQRLFDASEETLKPILLVAFDTRMRQREILDLRWEQVDLRQGAIRLAPQDTKGEESRLVVLTQRVRAVLKALPRGLPTTPRFRNPRRSLAKHPQGLPQGAEGRRPRRGLVPRLAPQFRHACAQAWRSRVGGDADVGSPHPRRVRQVQHRVRGRPSRCSSPHRGRIFWTRFGHTLRKCPQKRKAPRANYSRRFRFLVAGAGFEPATFGL